MHSSTNYSLPKTQDSKISWAETENNLSSEVQSMAYKSLLHSTPKLAIIIIFLFCVSFWLKQGCLREIYLLQDCKSSIWETYQRVTMITNSKKKMNVSLYLQVFLLLYYYLNQWFPNFLTFNTQRPVPPTALGDKRW